jgi:DNA polymerase elongation subunit (family B)
MLGAIHDLLNDADMVVHFNGKRFDIPIINRELVVAGMSPPAPYHQVDLLSVVKRQFRFASNKLAYVSVALGLEGKMGHEGHELWTKCLAGDTDAWARMEAYNRQDVVLTEQLYKRLLPWITGHPNRRLYGTATGCPTCGSGDLRKEGFALTQLGRYQRYSCRGCGSWSKDSKRLEGTDVRGVA